MADNGDPHNTDPIRSSGNRWEPDPQAPKAEPSEAQSADAPEGQTSEAQTPEADTPAAAAAQHPYDPTDHEEDEDRGRRFTLPAGRRALAGAAVGALLVGGLGGFGVGYAAADRGNEVELSGFTTDDGGDLQRGPGGGRGQFGDRGGDDLGGDDLGGGGRMMVPPDQDSGGVGPMDGAPIGPDGVDEGASQGADGTDASA